MIKKIESIQYLRAVAVLMVVIFHLFNLRGELLFFKKSGIGFYGVVIFFVISGAIMSHIISKENNVLSFVKKRFWRIYPTYFQVLTITSLMAFFFAKPYDFLDQISLMFFEFKYDQKTGFDWMVLPVAWTLYYEIFFYMVVAASLALFKKPKIGIYIFFGVVVFTKKIFGFDSKYFLEFIAGFCLMEFIKDNKKLDLAVALMCVGALFLHELHGLFALLTLAAIKFGIDLEKKDKLFKSPTLELVGNASYSIYLLHWSLIYPYRAFLNYFKDYGLFVLIPLSLALFVAIIGIGILNYIFFEKYLVIKKWSWNKLIEKNA